MPSNRKFPFEYGSHVVFQFDLNEDALHVEWAGKDVIVVLVTPDG